MRKLVTFVAAVIFLVAISFSVSATPNRPFSVQGTTYGSLNWGGYAFTSGSYSSVSGSWIVPEVNNSTTGYSSAWIGIGGFNGNTVIQIGTEQDCLSGSTTAGTMRFNVPNMNAIVSKQSTNPGNGNHGGGNGGHGGSTTSSCTPTYDAWWEFYPQNAEQVISGFTVKPGDIITASINRNNDNSWTLTINDATTGQTYTITETPNFTPDVSSAETIVERPALCMGNHCKITDLADFGTLPFSSLSVGSQSFSGSDGIVMVNNGGSPLISLGSLTDGGSAFSADWLASK